MSHRRPWECELWSRWRLRRERRRRDLESDLRSVRAEITYGFDPRHLGPLVLRERALAAELRELDAATAGGTAPAEAGRGAPDVISTVGAPTPGPGGAP